MKTSILLALFAVIAGSWFAGTASAADPRQITAASGATRGVAAPGRYVVFGHSSWEVTPGGYGGINTTPFSTRFYTVTAGELTATVGAKTDVYGVGQSFTVPAGIQSQVRNGSKTTTARFMLASLWLAGTNTLPGGVVTVPGSASPTDPARLTSGITGGPRAAQVPATIDVIQQIIDYEPGYRTPNHVMNHPHVITILRGEVTFGYLDGTVEHYNAGETAVMTPGRPGYMANETGEMATWQITWLQTPGTALTSPVTTTPVTALPQTGSGGLAGSDIIEGGRVEPLVVIAATVVGGLPLLVWRLRAVRRSRRV